jgi:hypothetical protein
VQVRNSFQNSVGVFTFNLLCSTSELFVNVLTVNCLVMSYYQIVCCPLTVKISGKLQDAIVFSKKRHDEQEPFQFKTDGDCAECNACSCENCAPDRYNQDGRRQD